MADERIQLLLDMGLSRENVQAVIDELDRLEGSAKKTAQATEEATGKTANMGQTMLQTGRIVQDFAQGGIGGVLNNIEGFIQALGMGSGLAGALTIVGVTFALVWPHLKKWIESLDDGNIAAKGHAEALKNLTEAGDKLKLRIAELHALSDVSLKKMAAENEMLEKQVKLEEARAAAKKAAADRALKEQVAAAGKEGEPSASEKLMAEPEKARAAELGKMIGGKPEAEIIRRRVALAVQNTQGFGHIDASQEKRDAEIARILGDFYAGRPEALDYVIGAMRGGNELPPEADQREGSLRGQLQQLTPGAQMGQRGRNIGETLRRFGGRVRGQAEAEARRRNNALVDQLNAQGKEGEIAAHDQKAAEFDEDLQKRKRELADMDRRGAELNRRADREVQDRLKRQREVGNRLREAPPPAAGKLPLMSEQTTMMEYQRQVLANQQQMVNNQAAAANLLKEARAIGQRADRTGRQLAAPATNAGWN